MKKHISFGLSLLLFATTFLQLSLSVKAASIYLSDDEQWIVGLSSDYEYITEHTYEKYNCKEAGNKYWTSIGSSGYRPDGTPYSIGSLVEGDKLQVASAWYGQNVYFRERGTSGTGTVIEIPAYSQLKEQYKKAIRVLNAYSPDTGDSFYAKYINGITDKNGYLKNVDGSFNIDINIVNIEVFNKQAKNMLTDAEGNYIYDLVAVGAYTYDEPDISGNAAWVLDEYIKEGYGFLVGHDTLYGYGGVTDENYVPDKNDTSTKYYKLNTKTNGHWNMNWLIGVNEEYTKASPFESDSLILSSSDYTDKSTMYGNNVDGFSELRIASVPDGDPETDISSRAPTNYPYSTDDNNKSFDVGQTFKAGFTHSNMQIAYGKVWIDFASNGSFGELVVDRNEGLTGTNNFYLTTNGNIGMSQIGHVTSNLNSATVPEARLLANTILYLSQREPCLICQSEQGGHEHVHAVKKISSAEELALIGNSDYEFLYPLDGCYVLSSDIELPEDWESIVDFRGHFNADNHKINSDGKAVFKQEGIRGLNASGWNLGTDPEKGINQISGLTGENTTGIARVVGTLNQLFKTGNDADYKGYTITLTDKNGEEYDCVVNREGKYVISNIATLPQEKLYAKVYKPDGAEVTEYGDIYAIIANDAWNNCVTVPLQLESDYIEPIEDQMVYEDEDVTFTAIYPGNELPDKVIWYYRNKHTDNDWTKATYMEQEGLDVKITGPEAIDKSEPYIEAILTIKDVPISWSDTNFKAVFIYGKEELDTFNSRTEGKTGLLTVEERPWTVYPVEDKTIWQGDEFTLMAQLTHYKGFTTDSSGLTAYWQYRTNEDSDWYDVMGSPFFEGVEVTNESSVDSIIPDETHNVSSLKIENAKSVIDGFQFRCVYEYESKYRYYYTDDVAEKGKEGRVNVNPLTIICQKSPQRIEIASDGANATGKYTYEAEFKYSSPEGEIDIEWLFKPNQQGEWKNISESPYASVMSASIGTPELVGENTYVVKATLTLTDPPIAMDSGDIHYYFKASATNKVVSANSGSADILFTYEIDIIPNEPVIKFSADGESNIYTYPNLKVIAPNGVTEFSVSFEDSEGTDTMSNGTTLSGVVAKEDNKGFTYTGSSLSAEQVQSWLRTVEMSVSTEEIDVNWRISEIVSGANSENAYGETIYEVITVPSSEDSDVTYAEAVQRASNLSTAYGTEVALATIDSEKENIFVSKLLKQSGADMAWIGNTINHDSKTELWSNTATSYSAQTVSLNYASYDKVMVVFRANPSVSGEKGVEEFYLMVDISDTAKKTAFFDYNDTTYISRDFQLVSGGISFGNGITGVTADSSVAVPYKVYGIKSSDLTSNTTDNHEVIYNPYNSNAIANMNSVGATVLTNPSFPWGTTFSTKTIALDDLYLVTNGSWNSAYSPGKWLFFGDKGSSVSWGSNYFQIVGPSAQVYTNSTGYGFSKKVPSSKYKTLHIEGYVPAIYHEAIGAYIGLNSNGWDNGFNTGYSITFPAYTHTTRTIDITNAPDYYFGMSAAGHGDANGTPIAATTFRLYNAWMSGGTDTIEGANVHSFVIKYKTYDAGYEHTDKTAKASDTVYGPEFTSDDSGEREIIPPAEIVETEYRTNTDVIISTGIYAMKDINPDNPASVTFTIRNVDGSVETKTFTDVCMPAGRSQRAYVRYNTGAYEGAVTVAVSTTGNIAADTSQINATVSKLVENTPPDPQGEDEKPESFSIAAPTINTNDTEHKWTSYTCENDGTGWAYTEIENTAYLHTVVESKADNNVPTATGKTMKSGYGINTTVTGQVTSNSSEYELPQTVIAYFPEFKYENYWRILEVTDTKSFRNLFEYKPNDYSIEGNRVHFIPVWFPDGNYKVNVFIRDAWTPVGELKGSFIEGQPIQIDGSIYDDWYAKETS